MTVAVETERSGVRRALLELVDVMVDAGAWVNPHLLFVENEGQISVWCHGDDPWLMRIPRAGERTNASATGLHCRGGAPNT